MWARRKRKAPKRLDGEVWPADKWVEIKTITPRIKREMVEKRYLEIRREKPRGKRKN